MHCFAGKRYSGRREQHDGRGEKLQGLQGTAQGVLGGLRGIQELEEGAGRKEAGPAEGRGNGSAAIQTGGKAAVLQEDAPEIRRAGNGQDTGIQRIQDQAQQIWRNHSESGFEAAGNTIGGQGVEGAMDKHCKGLQSMLSG